MSISLVIRSFGDMTKPTLAQQLAEAERELNLRDDMYCRAIEAAAPRRQTRMAAARLWRAWG